MEVSPNTILVVEDNEATCKLFSFLLEKAGYSLVICRTGKDALTWLEDHLPILIICDISLPDMRGGEILDSIRRFANAPNLPVIAVTAIARKGDKEKFLEQGFTGYISKPINTVTFVSEIQKYIKQ
jgi:CheY-like chemotaxis protein